MECCPYCSRFLGKEKSSTIWDQRVLETDNFVVVPTRGAIVEGWLLVIPKEHYLSFGAIPHHVRSEALQLLEHTLEITNECWGPATVFEHGPVVPTQPLGCGVDHAHLHVVPLSFDLVGASLEHLPSLGQPEHCSGLSTLQELYLHSIPYLYVREPNNQQIVWKNPLVKGQFFRRVIASALGVEDEFDWRKFDHESRIVSTLERIERCLTVTSSHLSASPLARIMSL